MLHAVCSNHCWKSAACIPRLELSLLLTLQVAEETEAIQEFVRAADTPPGHAVLAELHLSDLYSDFEGQDSAGSRAPSSQLPSGEKSSEAPVPGQTSSNGVTDGGQLLPNGSAESSGDMYAFSDSALPGTAPSASQNGRAQLRSGSGGSDGDLLPNPRRVSLKGDDIYAAFGGADAEGPGPQPAASAPPAVPPLQRPPQPPSSLRAKSQSSTEASRRQPRSFRQSSEQPHLSRPRQSCDQPQPRRPRPSCDQSQLGRPRPSSDRRRSIQQLQQRTPLAHGHAARKSTGAGSIGAQQPASAAVSTGAQGSEATYAIYQKYHQAHPLPLPAPPQPLPELPPLEAAAPPPVRIKDATYNGEDAFTVYGHFADGSMPQQPTKAEDGSYAGEDAYSVYGRFMGEGQPAAAEAEHDLYTNFAEAQP